MNIFSPDPFFVYVIMFSVVLRNELMNGNVSLKLRKGLVWKCKFGLLFFNHSITPLIIPLLISPFKKTDTDTF